MSARDDYPILVAWLRGMPVTGINGDGMEIAVAQALDEIDRLRAEITAEREFADRLGTKLARHGWGDFHYSTELVQEPRIVALLHERRQRRAPA